MTSRRRLLAAVPLVAFAAAMLSPLIFGGRIFHFSDFGRFYAPVKAVCLERMLDGGFPLWLPELNCGLAVHGELVHGLLYPGNLFLLFGGTVGWGLFFAFHLALAGFGTCALARHLGADGDGALLAGIAFAGSGYIVAQMNHVPYLTATAWCPVVILFGLRAAAGRTGAVPLLALAFTLAAVGGEPFLLLLSIAFLTVLVLAGTAEARRVRGVVSIGVAGITALLLASPALLPAIETLSASVRSTGVFTDKGWEDFGGIHPLQVATLFAPEACGRLPSDPLISVRLFGTEHSLKPFLLPGAYLGAVPLVLLWLAPFRTSRAARLLGAIAIASFILSLGAYAGVATWIRDYVPGMSVFRFPYKYWLLGTLAVALLAGLGARRGRWSVTAIAGIGAILALLAGVAMGRVGAGLTGLTAFALAAATPWVPSRFAVRFLTAILAAELLFFGLRQNATEAPENLSPMNGIGAAVMADDPGRIFVDFHFPPDEARRLIAERTVEMSRSLFPDSGLPDGFSHSFGYDPPESNWRIIAFLRSSNAAAPPDRGPVIHRLLKTMGTTHFVGNIDLRNDPDLHLIGESGTDVRAFAYLEPYPRARLFGSARVVRDYAEAQRHLADLRFDAEEVLLLEGEGESEVGGRPVGGASIIEDTPRRVRVRVRLKDAAWLFLADAIAPGWTVTVNGQPAELRTANIAFRAVRVPGGTSEVEFLYAPRWLAVAPWTFGAGLLGLLLLTGAALRARRRRSP